MIYVPKDREQKLLESAERYQRIRGLLNQLSEINLKKLRG